MIQEILIFTVGNGLLIGALAFLARSIIRHFLEEDLEAFKSKVKAEADKRHFIFQRLYEKKLDVISILYERSVEAGRAAKYVVEMQGNVDSKRIPDFENKIRGFKEQYEVARLWLNDDCCDVIDNLVNEQSVFYKVVNAANLERSGLGKDWVGREYLSLWERVQSELPAAQEKLRQAFQSTIKDIKP